MDMYQFDIVVVERRLYKNVVVSAETEEEAFKKARNFDWEDCLDEEELETLKIESVDMW